jgi:hypothetical protein
VTRGLRSVAEPNDITTRTRRRPAEGLRRAYNRVIVEGSGMDCLWGALFADEDLRGSA